MVALIRQIIKLEDGSEIAPNNNSRIQAMDWQIADSSDFKNIVLRSENDTKNLSSMVFTDILDPNIKWHARARALIKDSGWTVWGNLDIMNYEQAEDVITSSSIPSRVGTPILSTSSVQDNHDATLFSIFATGFTVVGNSTHAATSWFIEDINSKLIWSDLGDTINKNKVDFRSMILKNNSIYRIRAMFHSSSGDVSSIASYTIRVGSENSLELVTYLDNVDYRYDFPIKAVMTDMDAQVDSATWQIISMANNYAEIIFNKTTTGTGYGSVTIPANLLADDTNYILKYKPNIENGSWKYTQFKTMNIEAYHTSLVVDPTNIELKVDETAKVDIITPADNVTFANNSLGIVDFSLETKLVTGLKAGNGSITITAQEPDKYANSVNVAIIVTEKDPEFTLVDITTVDVNGKEFIPVKYKSNGELHIDKNDNATTQIEDDTIIVSATDSAILAAKVIFAGKTKSFDIPVVYKHPSTVGNKYKVTGHIILGEALPDSWSIDSNDMKITNVHLAGMLNKTVNYTNNKLLTSIANVEQAFKASFQVATIEEVTEDGNIVDDDHIVISSRLFKNTAGGTSTQLGSKQEISYIITDYNNVMKELMLTATPVDNIITTTYQHTQSKEAYLVIKAQDIIKFRRSGITEIITKGYYVTSVDSAEISKPLDVKLTLNSIGFDINNITGEEKSSPSAKIELDTDGTVKPMSMTLSIISARKPDVKPIEE